MSRRLIVPGTVYHVIARFVASQFFIPTDVERRHYLALFSAALAVTDWRCLSFAIMSNHIHLAMLAGVDKFGTWIRNVHRPFAMWTNERLERRIGAVFTKGPKTFAVEPEGICSLMAYIHNNPVRANVVRSADESHWTSQQMYAGIVDVPQWLDAEAAVRLSGLGSAAEIAQWARESSLSRKDLQKYNKDPVRGRGRPPTSDSERSRKRRERDAAKRCERDAAREGVKLLAA